MCFSKRQSFINFYLLIICGLYKINEWRLGLFLIFLGFKDLIQAFLYKNINNPKQLNFYTILSWVHVCFQPLFVNIFFSYFDINFKEKEKRNEIEKEKRNEIEKEKEKGNEKEKEKEKEKRNKIWYVIYSINLIYGIISLFLLKDINGFSKNCVGNPSDNFCKKNTKSYLGKIHIGYQFNINHNKIFFKYFYFILTFVPGLFSNAYTLYIFWLIFILIIKLLSNKINLRNGEFAAIWCFSSILIYIPLALFSKQFLKFFQIINFNIKGKYSWIINKIKYNQ
jgi:hypothetical protein